MKVNTKETILLALLSMIIMSLLFIFIIGNFRVFEWRPEIRFALVLVALSAGFITVGAINMNNNNIE